MCIEREREREREREMVSTLKQQATDKSKNGKTREVDGSKDLLDLETDGMTIASLFWSTEVDKEKVRINEVTNGKLRT